MIGLKGAGGFGKSALAEVVRGDYQQTQNTLAISFNQAYSFAIWGRWLLAHFGVPVDDQVSSDRLVNLVIAQLSAGHHLVILDNLETLLRPDGSWLDKSYEMFLLGWLSIQSNSTVLITSREEPIIPGNMRPYCKWQRMDGLGVSAGVSLLQELGILGGISELQRLVDAAEGHPLLLKLAAGWLIEDDEEEPHVNNLTNIGGVNLFEIIGAHRSQPEISIANLLEATLERLPAILQDVLKYSSVYRQPFILAAAQATVDEPLSDHQMQLLARRSLLQARKTTIKRERLWQYQFQPLIQRYLNNDRNEDGHRKAVQFYLTKLQPHLGPGTQLADIIAYQELFYHLCQLEQRIEALNLLWSNTDEEGRYSSLDMVLQLQGHNQIRYELYELALCSWEPTEEEKERYADVLKKYGDVLKFLRRNDEALENYQTAIDIYRQIGARLGEANTLQAIGSLEENPETALEAYQTAQTIYSHVGDRYSQGRNLYMFISSAYLALNQPEQAVRSLQMAANIGEEIGFEPLREYALQKIQSIQDSANLSE